MIQLTIEATDGADLRKQLADILGTTAAQPVMPEVQATQVGAQSTEEAAAPAKRARAKKEVAEPAAEGESTGSASEGTTEAGAGSEASTAGVVGSTTSTSTTATAAASPSEVTIDDLRELTLSVVDKCGREKIEEILGQFGIARATQVADDQRGELAEALRDALAAAG